MLNKGDHLLLQFTPKVAKRFNVPEKCAVWPSKLEGKHIQVIAMADWACIVNVQMWAIKELKILKSKNMSPVLNIDLEEYPSFEGEKLLAAFIPELYASNPA